MSIYSAKPMSIRLPDPAGDGRYGAGRGGRQHTGVDLVSVPGELVLAPVSGQVTKLGWPYKSRPGDTITYRYVQITDDQDQHHRLFYVDPLVQMGEQVVADRTVVGAAQDICARVGSLGKTYGEQGMTNHIHYEIMVGRKQYIDPTERVV